MTEGLDSSALHRDMGRLEGRLTAVERELGSFKADFRTQLEKQGERLEAIDTKLGALTLSMREERASVRAGWWAARSFGGLIRSGLAALIGAAAALGVKIKLGG